MALRILIIGAVTILGFSLIQLYGAYRIYKRSVFRFGNFTDIKEVFEGDKQVTMRISNPTNRRLSIKNVLLQIEKNGVVVGGFKPIDLVVKPGENNITLVFSNDTRYLLIASDYILNSLRGYDILARGLWLGFIPFRVRLKLSEII